MASNRILIYPQILPVRVLHYLSRAGLQTTAQVHEHITNGTLRTLPGIGVKREDEIIHWYTKATS